MAKRIEIKQNLDFCQILVYYAYMDSKYKNVHIKNLPPEKQAEVLAERHRINNERNRLAARKNKVKTAAKKYGITEDELQGMITAANGICPLCTAPLGDSLHIDHCHGTGKVRGILCPKCNNGLGQFNDNPTVLRAAADYLDMHSAV